MKKFKIEACMAMAALLVLAGTAAATVTFYPETGTGFVGKGDVQSAFGWNNADAQNKMSGVTFQVRVKQERRQGCYDTAGQPVEVISYRYGTRSVASKVSYTARTHNQIDGIYLEGYEGGGLSDLSGVDWGGWTGPGGEILGGDECGKNPVTGGDLHPAHQPIVGDPTVEGLFVVYGGVRRQIWP